MDRILIADDEYLIRKGLKAILERSGLAFTEICECEDGLQALRQMTERKFDLAIMDIRMPAMDGLTAIKEALELESPPCFIILSGHDDFTYARQAIRFGVHDYLLKPVDMNELMASVRKVEEIIECNHRNRKQSEAYAKLSDAVFDNELNYILLNINLGDREITEIVDNLGAQYLKGTYRMMSFELAPGELSTAGEQEALKDAIMEVAAELDAYAVCTDFEKNILVIQPEAFDRTATRSAFEKRFGDGFILGVSTLGKNVADIRSCYLQAVECKKYRLLKGQGNIILCDNIVPNQRPFDLPIERFKRIQALVGTPQAAQIAAELNGIFDSGTVAAYGVDYLEMCSGAVNTYIVDYYKRLLPHSLEADDSRDIRSIYNFDSIESYLLALRNYLFSLDGFVQMLKAQYKENNKIDEVLQWLAENYSNPNISMSMAANQVSLNYTYFSLAFREHTGMSFVSFLKKLRIEKARELIDQHKYRIGQITRMVGFQNPRLFTKTFREETGTMPMEYMSISALLAAETDKK